MKVLPSPSADCTAMLPPWVSTIFRLTYKPTPEPEIPLRRAFVARLGVSPSAYQQRFRSAQRRDAAAGPVQVKRLRDPE